MFSGGAKIRGGLGDGSPPVGSRGEAPVGSLGAKPPEADDLIVKTVESELQRTLLCLLLF